MWSKVLAYYIRLNDCFKKHYNRDILNFKEDVIMFLKDSCKIKEFSDWQNYDIDHNRTLECMSKDDLLFFTTLLTTSQKEDLLLLKYSEDAMWLSTVILNTSAFLIYDKLLRYFRGITINIKDFDLVCTPFDKFANVDEYGWEENKIENIAKEFQSAKLIETSNKLDGSLQIGRYYKGEYLLTGSGSLLEEQSQSLKEGHNWLNSIENDNYREMLKDNPNDTHIFEWISLADAHIVRYNKEDIGLYLIGIRNIVTGKQYSYKEVNERAKKYNIRTTELYTKTLQELLNDCKTYKSNEKEGFVIRLDDHFIKLKCEDYISIVNLIKETSSTNEIIRAIYYNDTKSILDKLPKEQIDFIKRKMEYIYLYVSLMKKEIERYFSLAPKESKKEFVLWIQHNAPKLLFKELIRKYENRENTILGEVNVNRYGENIEKIKKIKDIEDAMIVLGQPTFADFLNGNC